METPVSPRHNSEKPRYGENVSPESPRVPVVSADGFIVEQPEYKAEVILSDIQRKSEAESLAWDALKTKLTEREGICPMCKGKGEVKKGPCPACNATGKVQVEPDMRAVELVLSPKFPKTTINLNSELDSMSTDQVIKSILGM